MYLINPLIPKIEEVPRKVVHLYLETKGFHLYQDGMTLAEKKLIHSTFVTNSSAKSKTSGFKLFHISTRFHRRVNKKIIDQILSDFAAPVPFTKFTPGEVAFSDIPTPGVD